MNALLNIGALVVGAPILLYAAKFLVEGLVGIAANGGGSLLIEGKPVNTAEDERIANAFLEASTEECQKIANKCDDFLNEIAAEGASKNSIFAEVEEKDEDFDKLKHWFKKVEERHLVKNPHSGTGV